VAFFAACSVFSPMTSRTCCSTCRRTIGSGCDTTPTTPVPTFGR
jgi:hypothetical protein